MGTVLGASSADVEERDRRIEHAREIMRMLDLEGLVVSDFAQAPQPAYARYLSGFHLSPAIGAVNPIVVVPREGELTLVVPPGQKRSFAHLAAARSWIPNISTTYQDDPQWELDTRWGHLATYLGDGVTDALREAGLESARIGVAGSWSGFEDLERLLPEASFEPTIAQDGDRPPIDLLVDLIWTNSDWELERLEIAQRASDAATRAYISAARGGAGTREAFLDAETEAKRVGVDDVTLYGSAGVGPWAFWDLAHPAHERFATDRVYFIEVALAGWAGFGVQSGRSFVVGAPSDRQQLLIHTSQRALDALFGAVRPGVTGGELWEIGCSIARDAGLESWAQFGHHKGLLPGSSPRRIAFMPRDENRLDSGQTVVVHPGLYDAATGDAAFIGDTVLVGEDGCRLLTESPLGYGLEDN
jgi:Xaa-Pro aminopeptidase